MKLKKIELNKIIIIKILKKIIQKIYIKKDIEKNK